MAPLLPLDPLVDLLAVHRDVPGRVDSDVHLIAFDAEHGDGHFIPDPQGLQDSSCQYQHLLSQAV